jgi:hypothetical protein
LTDGRGRVRTSIPCSLRCHGTDGRQRGSSVLPPARPSVIIARPASCCPYAFGSTHTPVWVLATCLYCMYVLRAKAIERASDRSSLLRTRVQVSHHRMSHSNAGAGYEFRIFHRFLLASYLSGPKMVTFRDRLASVRCPRWCSLVATVPLRRLVGRHRLAFSVGDAGPGVKAAQWCVHRP